MGIYNIAYLNNPSNGGFCWMETSQLICDISRLAGCYTMRTPIVGVFRESCRIIFFASILILLLTFLLLLLIFSVDLLYLVILFTFFSTQDCANPMGKSLIGTGYRAHGIKFLGIILWSLRLFQIILLLIGKSFIFKDAG